MRITARPWILAAIAAAPAVGVPQPAGAQTSYETLNVCQRVPAPAVAGAVSGRVVDEKPINFKGLTAARCVYGVEIAGSRRVFVVWVNPVNDFDDLRKASDPPVSEVKGVGDAAFVTTDQETKRVQLTAVARGKVTVQVTSERLDWAQLVAKVALSKF